jgi:hypothetical protein
VAGSDDHTYPLFAGGRAVGRLAWRAEPRREAGWHLTYDGETRRLLVDTAIDDLRTSVDDEHAWAVHAEVAAILSTALALDAAERAIHERPRHHTRRFQRLERTPYEIYLRDVEPAVVSRAVPELSLASVSDVIVLEGPLTAAALTTILRRLKLLGGAVVEVITRAR